MLGRRATVLASFACSLAGASLAPAAVAPASPRAPAPDGRAAACGHTEVFAARRDAGPGRPPLVIGDSVMLGAAEEVARLGYTVDVRGCRMATEGLERLELHARAEGLPRFVVIALGSNSDVTARDIGRALRILGPRRRLGLVTPNEIVGTPPRDARTMRRMADRRADRIVLVDWARRSGGRRALTASDGIHLTIDGRQALTRMMRKALRTAFDPAPEWEYPDSGTSGGARAPIAGG